jgi:lantibiotic biosynthesis protein
MMPPSEPAKAWFPVLEGVEAARALTAVSAVAEAIGEAPLPIRNGTNVAAGEAGVALFFSYLERARPGAGFGEIALVRLERAIDALASSTQNPSLYSGFTGIAWVAEHFQSGLIGEEDANEDVDSVLLRLLRETSWTHEFDLMSGLAGYAVYALERLPRPSAVACLELVVERLADSAQARPGGLTWYTPREMLPEPNRPWFPQGCENLGVAHGTPGVIAVLARICASGVAVERARPLLEAAVSWMLAQKLPEREKSVFPYMVGREVKLRPARTAWCYGDPGIAAALLAAGRAVGNPTWEREALSLSRAVAHRQVENCGVNDAGLCHGAAGLGHLLNRLHQASGDPELLVAARAWFNRALSYWEPGRGIGGFLALTPLDDDFEQLVWNDDPGFLTGSAGVALALLAAASDVEPAWDRLLLSSPLPATSAADEVLR